MIAHETLTHYFLTPFWNDGFVVMRISQLHNKQCQVPIFACSDTYPQFIFQWKTRLRVHEVMKQVQSETEMMLL